MISESRQTNAYRNLFIGNGMSNALKHTASSTLKRKLIPTHTRTRKLNACKPHAPQPSIYQRLFCLNLVSVETLKIELSKLSTRLLYDYVAPIFRHQTTREIKFSVRLFSLSNRITESHRVFGMRRADASLSSRKCT